MGPGGGLEGGEGGVKEVLFGDPPLLSPPATSTSPFASSVAVWSVRAVVMLPVAVHLPVVWLYSSALGGIVVLPTPATSTSPFASSGAGWGARAEVNPPVPVQAFGLRTACTVVRTT